MNSFRSLRSRAASPRQLRRNAVAALLGSAALALLSGAASAQEAPQSMQGLPQTGIQQETAPSKVLGLPAGASVGDSAERVKTMSGEAARDLEALVGSAVTPETEAEQRAGAERQREINVLRDRLEQAKIAKELYEVLNGENTESDEKIAALEAEKAALEKRVAEAATAATAGGQRAATVPDPLPVVARVSGTGLGMSATILVPYVGEIRAGVGTVLPDGRRVVSIGQAGVVTVKGGQRDTLAFGTSVPRQRPVSLPAGTGQAPGMPMMPAMPASMQ